MGCCLIGKGELAQKEKENKKKTERPEKWLLRTKTKTKREYYICPEKAPEKAERR